MSRKLLAPQYALWELGSSVQNRRLEALAILPASAAQSVPPAPAVVAEPWILCMAAVHGDEIEGVWLLQEMRRRWTSSFPFEKVGVILWVQANPDGVALGQRWNASGVDLNRNLPSKDWSPEVKNPRYPPGPAAASEPETKALLKLLEACNPRAILSVHSFSSFQVNANGPSRQWAERLGQLCGYPVTEDIGYPTPGSLGSYAGVELNIPTITLEIERGLAQEKVLALHGPVAEEAIRFWEEIL